MKFTYISIIILLLVQLSALGQSNLILDSAFSKIDFYEKDTSFQLLSPDGWLKVKNGKNAMNAFVRKSDGQPVLQMNFRVSSVQVEDNFISTQLTEELKAGETYLISFEVSKDKFSGFSVKELGVLFSNSTLNNSLLKYNDWQNSSMVISMDSVFSNAGMVKVSGYYVANGGEKFLHFGSINQSFKFFETTKYNLMMADASYKTGISNSVYYTTNFSVIKVMDSIISSDKVKSVLDANVYDLYNDQSNLILNGGFEGRVTDKMNTTWKSNPGDLIAPFVHSITGFTPIIYQTDSNAYRSSFQKEELPYMGNSLVSFKALATNEGHKYQQSTYIEKGSSYDTYYYYETQPTSDSIPTYKNGASICFSLKDTLQKDSVYTFSMMIKLDPGSSYGLNYLGCHFLSEFPKNINTSQWERTPDEVIPTADLLKDSKWVEKRIIYTAKGGELFVALSAVYPNAGVSKNLNFQRSVREVCGPNGGYCISKYVYYNDSLFANYYLDNVVCLPSKAYVDRPSKIHDENVVQLEVLFSPMLRLDEMKEAALQLAKDAIVNSLNILRSDDAICIVDAVKKDQVILDPYIVINKKKIIRKINKPDLQRKIKEPLISDELILFSGEVALGFHNHLFLIIDNVAQIENIEFKLSKFDKNGGYITFIVIKEDDDYSTFIKAGASFKNALVINATDGEFKNSIVKRLMLKM